MPAKIALRVVQFTYFLHHIHFSHFFFFVSKKDTIFMI